MATIDKKISAEELDVLVKQYVEKKKKSPSRIDRQLAYKIYNQFFNSKQLDVNSCTCLDRSVDSKVTMYIEQHYKYEEPLPILSNVSVDMSALTTGKSADDDLLNLSDLIEDKPKRTRRKKQA